MINFRSLFPDLLEPELSVGLSLGRVYGTRSRLFELRSFKLKLLSIESFDYKLRASKGYKLSAWSSPRSDLQVMTLPVVHQLMVSSAFKSSRSTNKAGS